MKKELIELRVNGRSHELAIEPTKLLLDALRQDLQLTGSKRACDDSSCGFLLSNNSDPTEAEVRSALSSNLCRCTGYSQMYQAIKAAIEAEQKGMAVVK